MRRRTKSSLSLALPFPAEDELCAAMMGTAPIQVGSTSFRLVDATAKRAARSRLVPARENPHHPFPPTDPGEPGSELGGQEASTSGSGVGALPWLLTPDLGEVVRRGNNLILKPGASNSGARRTGTSENDRSACAVLPLSLIEPHPKTPADVLDRIERELAPGVANGSSAAYSQRNCLRTLYRHLSTILKQMDKPFELEQIVKLTRKDYMRKLKVKPERARALHRLQRIFLRYAVSSGWTCEEHRRIEAWVPVREALRAGRGALGCMGIVTFAINRGLWPGSFSDNSMNAWRKMMMKKHRSLYTIEVEEIMFRRKVREAGLKDLFPFFNLDSRNPPSYYISLDDMAPPLRDEILDIVKWRVKGCDDDFRIRQVSADSLLKTLLELCGFATRTLNIGGITSLREILTEEVITKFRDWLRNPERHHPEADARIPTIADGSERGRPVSWGSIANMLHRVYAVIQLEHRLFAGRKDEYKWFGLLLRRMPKEPKEEVRKRKLERSVPYREFLQIRDKIRSQLKRNKSLTPLQRARLFRDYFFCSAIARHPWRHRNWKECRIDTGSDPNICYMAIPRRVQREGKLPAWVKAALKKSPKQQFWMCHFVEHETKGKNEIWEPLDPSLVKILLEYRDVHRPLLVGDECSDPGVLVVNNAGNVMSEGQLTKHLAYLALRWIGKRLDVHILRDIVTEHALARGCTFEQVRAALWHKDARSTPKYLSRVNASHGAVALEKHFRARKCGRV